MKTEHFTYINTGDKPVGIIYDYVDENGNKHHQQDILGPKNIATDSTAKTNLKITLGSERFKLLDVRIVIPGDRNTATVQKSIMKPDALGSIKEILKNSVIADIETLGMGGGSTMTQLGVYDVGTGRGTMIVPSPQLIEAPPEADLRFRSRLGTRVDLSQYKDITFKDIKYAETLKARDELADFDTAFKQYKAMDSTKIKELEKYFFETDEFQARYFIDEDALLKGYQDKYKVNADKAKTYLDDIRPIRAFISALDSGMTETDIDRLLTSTRGMTSTISNLFTDFSLITGRSMQDMLTKELPDLTKSLLMLLPL